MVGSAGPRRPCAARRTIEPMPASAFALVVFFVAVSIVIGVAATWIVGPRRRLAIIVPVLAAFLALYVVGHRGGLELGPTMILFGFQVAIVQDVVVAVVAAGLAALLQRSLLTRRATNQGA